MRKALVKKRRFKKSLRNNSGIILLVVLWTLVVLTALAMSLGRSTNIELALTKFSVSKIKSKYPVLVKVLYFAFSRNKVAVESELVSVYPVRKSKIAS